MKITRSSETLAGTTVLVEDDTYCLTLYKVGNCFSDSISEIIIELPEYDIDNVSDIDAEKMFNLAKRQYEDMKSILDSDEL